MPRRAYGIRIVTLSRTGDIVHRAACRAASAIPSRICDLAILRRPRSRHFGFGASFVGQHAHSQPRRESRAVASRVWAQPYVLFDTYHDVSIANWLSSASCGVLFALYPPLRSRPNGNSLHAQLSPLPLTMTRHDDVVEPMRRLPYPEPRPAGTRYFGMRDAAGLVASAGLLSVGCAC